jgi:hypothetical protein
MSTIRSLIAGAAVVSTAAGIGLGLAATGSASAGTAATSGSFLLHAHNATESNIDLGKGGFSAGDQDLMVASLARQGKAVGRLVGNCTTVRVGKASADQLCEFVLHFGKGQITASGTVRSGQAGPGTFVLPILGGTGRYQGATGQIAVTATNGKSIPIQVTLR